VAEVVVIKREQPFGLDQKLSVRIPYWERVTTEGGDDDDPEMKESHESFDFYPKRIPGVVVMALNGTSTRSNIDALYDFFRAGMDAPEYDRLYRFLNDPKKAVRSTEIGPIVDAIIEFEAKRPTPPRQS
jgi:hypothetical protein